jgi:hypothetical protein
MPEVFYYSLLLHKHEFFLYSFCSRMHEHFDVKATATLAAAVVVVVE